ncbi:SPRY domain-containing protein, partial [Pseudomonadota bacterium]
MGMLLAPQMLAWMKQYNIANAALFDGTTGYLSRTFVEGDQAKWTFSTWVRKDKANRDAAWFPLLSSATTTNFEFAFYAGQLRLYMAGVYKLITTQVFDDSAAMMHVMLVLDTNNATAALRARIYVNGEEVTAFDTDNRSTLSGNYEFNAAGANYFCRGTASEFFPGYAAETVFIGGATLTPSSFGEVSKDTGNFVPVSVLDLDYSGTNSCYLDYANSVALGEDQSGNGNDWTVNGAITQVTDTPTNVVATWNPLFPNNGLYRSVFSNGNRTIKPTSTSYNMAASATLALPTSGKWQWEVHLDSDADWNRYGICKASDASRTIYIGTQYSSYGYADNGQKYDSASANSYGATFTAGDVITVLWDADVGTLAFKKNNVSQGDAFTGLDTSVEWIPFIWCGSNTGQSTTGAFAEDDMTYALDSGCQPLTTNKLPAMTATDKDVNRHFKTVTWTGNGTSQSITGVGFQPALVWSKSRSHAVGGAFIDAIRGVGQRILSWSTAAEYDGGSTMLSSFDADGFSIGSDNEWNASAYTYVGWCFNLPTSQGNTDGSITVAADKQRAGATGFEMSITEFTGTGANATVGHGLSKAPGWVAFKRLTGATGEWVVYHVSVGPTGALQLNSTAAVATSSAHFNDIAPTSTVVSVGTNPDCNASGDRMLM